jgi:hypothetical protein
MDRSGTWVHGVVEIPINQDREFLVLPRRVAEQQARWVQVLSSGTWGDVRASATEDEYTEILERAGYGSFEGFVQHLSTGRPIPGSLGEAKDSFDDVDWETLPTDDQPFAPFDDIPSVADGDFPPSVHFLMNQLLPSEIVEKYGERYETILNGTFARFAPEVARDLVKDMRDRGFDLEENTQLLTAVMAMFG